MAVLPVAVRAVSVAQLTLAMVVSWSACVVAQSRTVVQGRVVDSAGRPMAGVEIRHVIADSIQARLFTSDSGLFAVTPVGLARERIVARRLGFTSVERAVGDSTRDSLTIVLLPLAAHLESFEVFGRLDPQAWLSDFYRRRRDNSFGRYFTGEEISRSGKSVLSDLLRQTSGVTLTPSRRFGYVVRMRGCRDAPMVWLDGTRLPGAELDEIANPTDVAALEVYPSTAGVPAQFLDRSNRGCGTILIWTRHR